jgi:hypothetical protein
MMEPLPKLRSICESAASRARNLSLSIDELSTRRGDEDMTGNPYGTGLV